jgi:hypothetical protein
VRIAPAVVGDSMISRARSLAFAVVALAAAFVAAPAFAITIVAPPNPSDFSIFEGPGQYTVNNHSTDWYIYAFAVSNPGAVPPGSATTGFSNWNGYLFLLSLNSSGLQPAFAYATADADVSNPAAGVPLTQPFTPAHYIGPGTSSSDFFFDPALVFSDFGILLVNANGINTDQVSGITTTPLPAALPLFAAGAGLIGFAVRRRNRKAAAT